MSGSFDQLSESISLTAFNNLDEPVRVWDSNLNIVFANKAASSEQGAPISIMMNRFSSASSLDEGQQNERDLVRKTFEEGTRQKAEISGIDTNGDRWVTEIRTKPILGGRGHSKYVVATFLDRSQEKRLERQLLQSSKLVSIGELATGIAHEIRNPLAGIRLGLDALDPVVCNDNESREILVDITQDINRLDRVVSELLNFAKPKPNLPDWFEAGKMFRQVSRFIRGIANKSRIRLKVQVEPEDLMIYADPNQIQQVVLNLTLNAIQAMPEGGKLTMEARKSDNVNWSTEREDPAGYRIIVRDTGCGIPEDLMHRLFDPFFTTKQNGTGLGLTTSLSIVGKHAGELRINSTPDVGTTAQILLPEVQR
ncbi:MAG: PAS domain-containing protein [Candidatus Omnitrophica bacterium]|nr:PAS domain-containing protein [Candidatus Omnitrophota bacterium]